MNAKSALLIESYRLLEKSLSENGKLPINKKIQWKLEYLNEMHGLDQEDIHGYLFEYFITKDYQRNLTLVYPGGNTYPQGTDYDNPFSKYSIGINLGTGFKFILYKGKEASVNLNYLGGISFGYAIIMSNIILLNLGIPIL